MKRNGTCRVEMWLVTFFAHLPARARSVTLPVALANLTGFLASAFSGGLPTDVAAVGQ
jgi:hypothetical protein